jgi:hypothetical protein
MMLPPTPRRLKLKRSLKPRLAELLDQRMLSLYCPPQSAIDLEICVNFAGRGVDLFHPRQSVRSLLDRKHLSRVLLDIAVALPKCQCERRAVFFQIRPEVVCALFAKSLLECSKVLAVADWRRDVDHDWALLVLDGSSNATAERAAEFPRCEDRERKWDSVYESVHTL